jgi:hypothetical protein
MGKVTVAGGNADMQKPKLPGILSIAPTSLSLTPSTPTGTIIVSRAGLGEISAVSSNTSVATVTVSGDVVTVKGVGDGSAIITISAAASDTHKSPEPVTCSVTVDIGILAKDISVGSIVYLLENGSPVPYVAINQGIPSNSTLYDGSCDGLWLMRREIVTCLKWNSYFYATNQIHTYLTGTFYNLFDSATKAIIKTAKIPYVYGSGTSGGSLRTGSSGLSTKVFLLSAHEIPNASIENVGTTLTDGAPVEYSGELWWNARITPSANDWQNCWWVRTTYAAAEQVNYVRYEPWIWNNVTYVQVGWERYGFNDHGIRPALILPNNAVFDEDTMILKGVA